MTSMCIKTRLAAYRFAGAPQNPIERSRSQSTEAPKKESPKGEVHGSAWQVGALPPGTEVNFAILLSKANS